MVERSDPASRLPDDLRPPHWLRQLGWIAAIVLAVFLAIVGIAVYARDPRVGTYQLNQLLTLPLIVLVGIGLHRLLPMRIQWLLAIVFAPLGGIAYVMWPDEQLWNYGALTALPLVALAAVRDNRLRKERENRDGWSGGATDGPWGPPA